jgi:toxin YoeB
MQIDFSSKAKEDLNFWIKSGNKSLLNKIYSLIEDIQLHPFEGIGKPEPLKHNLTGFWSRRINQEHRIIYEIIDENTVIILSIISLKGHYE